jgi:uncharacterized protein
MQLDGALKKKEARLQRNLKALDRVLVAFSGGTDSSLLLYEAVATLGADRVRAVTAVSQVFPAHERKRALALSKRFKVEHLLLDTGLLDNQDFCRNPAERCYHCKHGFLIKLLDLGRKIGFPIVVEASQADDRGDFRPGSRAVKELGVLSPLLKAGMNKAEVRRLSRFHSLPTADLPAAACLASRVPYGTKITGELLTRIGKGEEAIRKLGFHQFRLRHHGDTARLEFHPSELERAFRYRRSLTQRIEAAARSRAPRRRS